MRATAFPSAYAAPSDVDQSYLRAIAPHRSQKATKQFSIRPGEHALKANGHRRAGIRERTETLLGVPGPWGQRSLRTSKFPQSRG